ncbi:MAG: DUF3795 domain-containing protein [Anaerolineales bacterium]|nr:DUF3795 domain-containing protein [Anaerolineales bacterium]
MTTLIAPCGLDCAQCEAYKLTQVNDLPGLAALVEKWKIEFNAPDMTLESAICDGCLATSGRLGGYCALCEIRKCAVEHRITTCAECREYGCQKLQTFWQGAPQAQANLEALRAA